MQVNYQDHGIMGSWTDPAPHSYGNTPIDESATGLLTSESPCDSPSNLPQHPHHRHQNLHHPHHLQQRQHNLDHKLATTTSEVFVSHPHSSYSLSEVHDLANFEYANHVAQPLISHSSEMRTGPGGGGRVEGGGVGRRAWKRKRESKDGEEAQQPKIDASHRCDVCGEQASGRYFGALVCLPCKSFFIRCTKDGRPNFSSQCGGKCDVLKGGRVRCQHCRFQKCMSAGMYRKEKPEAVEPGEGQLLCKVCGDIANGVHFGVTTCEGCKKFFRRGLKENRAYTCKGNMHCSINPRMRNNCRYCRYQKCINEGMSREAIKMGRPKKGDVAYRKPLKSNRLGTSVRGSYEKQLSESNRTSMSSEYEQDEVSTSDDVFDQLSTAQHQQLHPNHHSQLQQQQQQSGSFSLGSILHDCMTVQDWDQKVDIGGLDQGVHRVISHSAGSGGMIEQGKNSPLPRQASPSLLSGMLSRQMHEQQHSLPETYQLHLQNVKVMDSLQNNLQQKHQVVAYQVHHTPNSVPHMEAIPGMDYPNEHDLPVNRAIKVENVSLQDGPDADYTENVVLENMRNLEPASNSDFQTYQLQGIDPNTVYNVSDHQDPSSPLPDGSPQLVSISHLNPAGSSQIVAINMSSQSILYTPHNHQDPIIIHNVSHPQPILTVSPNQVLQHSNFEKQRTIQKNSNTDQEQQIKMNMLSPEMNMLSQRNVRIITNEGVISTAHHPHSVTPTIQIHNPSEAPRNPFSPINSSTGQPFISGIAVVGSPPLTLETTTSRRLLALPNEQNFSVLSPNGQHTITSFPLSISSSSQSPTNIRHKISGIKSPIAAILQQHRNAIQEGRPIHLSSEEIEELLNSVNAEQLSQRSLNEQVVLKDERNVSDHNNVEVRRQSVESFMVDHERDQIDEFEHYNRQSISNSSRNYQNINIPSQYQSNSPINTTQIHRSRYQNRPSPVISSISNDRQELDIGYPNNNNNNSQISHYISQQNIHSSPESQSSQNNEAIDDSFNSSLIRDSTLLHEINRIFLGIDNSCDAYGCGHQHSDDEKNKIDDKVIVSLMSPDEFTPEVSHKYWHGFQPPERLVIMNSERQKIISDVLDAFDSLQKTYMTNEPEYVNRKMSKDQLEHWHHIQRRIARHVVAGQRFCRNIPGYFKLDIQDRISLGKHVGFGLMVLIACTEFYDPEYKRFKHIWNWTMPMQNPLFSYKVHLLSLGDKIYDIQMDRTEASMVSAISMTSIDCPGLLKPEIVCVVRDALIDALQAHIYAKSESPQRLKSLLSIMPQVRLMTVWYNNLMKKMSLPSDVINSKISKARLTEAVGTENTPRP